jgi:IS5 family transposase
MEDTVIELFCLVDEFCKEFFPLWQQQLLSCGLIKRHRQNRLSPAEIMTIFIHFHQSHYRTFKHYYLQYVQRHLKTFFPQLVSYERFVALMKSVLVPLCFFMQTLEGEETGIYFVDSMLMKVCHIKREKQHKVFKGIAEKSKSSVGWYFGFKLHLVINDKGEIMAFKLTAANVDDRKPVPDLMKALIGKLFGDKGYISQELSDKLLEQGIQLITRVKKNMKNKLIPLQDKLLLRKRAVIESVNDQLKNICQIEHSRHRSIWNFLVNVLGALIAYALKPSKPSIRLNLQKLLS